jgi:hypothetical protein
MPLHTPPGRVWMKLAGFVVGLFCASGWAVLGQRHATAVCPTGFVGYTSVEVGTKQSTRPGKWLGQRRELTAIGGGTFDKQDVTSRIECGVQYNSNLERTDDATEAKIVHLLRSDQRHTIGMTPPDRQSCSRPEGTAAAAEIRTLLVQLAGGGGARI